MKSIKVGSVKCLIVLLICCVLGEVEFSRVQRLSNLKQSTAWSCVKKLEKEGMIRVSKRLTIKGPRTMLLCTKEGLGVLEEINEIMKDFPRENKNLNA